MSQQHQKWIQIGQREIEFRRNDTNASRSCLRSEEADYFRVAEIWKGQ